MAGLISRHPGTGTRVERSTPVAAFTAQLGTVGDLTQYGEAAVRSVLSVEPVTVDAALSAVTGLAEGPGRCASPPPGGTPGVPMRSCPGRGCTWSRETPRRLPGIWRRAAG
nr:hypothetical protein [Streptomyces rapamycinicus]